jgi:predicted dehydrogenase
MQKVRWGVLGVSRIATTKVIPAMQRGECCEIAAIASRDGAKAEEAAGRLGIPKAYGSYEEMLDDPGIEAVYNPLPNHMHVPWSIRAAEAGKHVLCEKPIGMNVAETLQLIAARDRTGVTMGEAFMVQSHPQWVRTMELVRTGRIGPLRSAIGSFSYFKLDAGNIRNIREYGGGGLMDIGCYPIKVSRMVSERSRCASRPRWSAIRASATSTY